MKVVFFGTDLFSLPVFKALYGSTHVKSLQLVCPASLGCVTKSYALQNSIPVDTLRESESFGLRGYFPDFQNRDIGVVASFGHFIPDRIINQFKYGIVNVHPSLLPRHRGASPLSYSILKGDKETGVSLFSISNKIDDGILHDQRTLEMNNGETFVTLRDRCSAVGAQMVVDMIENVTKTGKLPVVQYSKNLLPTFAPKLNPELTHLKPHLETAIDIFNKFRALHGTSFIPFICLEIPESSTREKMHVVSMKLASEERGEATIPGLMMRERNYMRIKCKEGSVLIESIRLPSKSDISCVDFFNSKIIFKNGAMCV